MIEIPKNYLEGKKRITGNQHPSRNKIIIFGSSAGGPNAIRFLLSELTAYILPPILIIQHMYKEMIFPWVINLQRWYPDLTIRIPKNGEKIFPHTIFVAEGGKHLEVNHERSFHIYKGNFVNFVMPSIDITLMSVAPVYGKGALACILTGTGRDGAHGAMRIKEAGGTIYAEDSSTALLSSMPEAVRDMGAADKILPLHTIPLSLKDDGWIW